MYASCLRESSFYTFLLQIDRDLAEQARRSRCRFCGAALHSACYPRKPRGLPAEVDPGPEYGLCFSFCCSAEGCRRRHGAPSVRFLGPKVYLGVLVLLLAAMRQGATPRTARELQRLFGASLRTLARWRRWWQAIFPQSDFWKRMRGRFTPPVCEGDLPQSLAARFTGDAPRDRIVQVLKFVSGLFSRW